MIESENQQLVNEKQKLPETEREYTFESGVAEIMKRIEALLTQKDYVVIEINGSGKNVGKSTLAGRLWTEFKLKQIPCTSVSEIDLFAVHLVKDLQEYQKSYKTRKGVIVFDAALDAMAFDDAKNRQTVRNGENRSVREIGDKFKLGVDRVDIIVAIYSPKRSFIATPVGDIVIRNEYAKD